MNAAWIVAWIVSLVIVYYIGKKSSMTKVLMDLASKLNKVETKKEVSDGGNNNQERSGEETGLPVLH